MCFIDELAPPLDLKLLDVILLEATLEERCLDLDHDELLVQVLHLELVLVQNVFSFSKALPKVRLVQLLLRQHDPCQDRPLGLLVSYSLSTHLCTHVLNDK